jgi:anti-sigma28 factor (negative regulator of flagellin synthesis)
MSCDYECEPKKAQELLPKQECLPGGLGIGDLTREHALQSDRERTRSRIDKVALIKEALARGSYDISSECVADALLRAAQQSRSGRGMYPA